MVYIPRGKQLRIRRGRESITGDIPLVLEEDIAITVSSSFEALMGGGDKKFLNLIGAIARDFSGGKLGFSGAFKQLGFQAWTGTDPMAFTANLGFFMGSTAANNARIEVYEPMIKLASLVLPEEGVGGNLIGPGPSVISAFEKIKEALGKKIGTLDDSIGGRVISLEIGRILRLDSIIVKRAEPTFSNEVDENGYPISGKLVLDINSLFTASVEMLNNRNFQKESTAGPRTTGWQD